MNVKVNLTDGLLDVPANVPLRDAFQRAAQLGILAPFPMPVSEVTGLQLLTRASVVGDAFVHSVSQRGANTPHAPRSAVGIDSLGGVMLGWKKLDRIRFRGLALSRACVTTHEFKNQRALVEFVLSVMAAGKYFSVIAHHNCCMMMGGDYVSPSDDNTVSNDWLEAFSRQDIEAFKVGQTPQRSINPADASVVAKVIKAKGCLLGAPFMGRLGVYSEDAHDAPDLFAGLRKQAAR